MSEQEIEESNQDKQTEDKQFREIENELVCQEVWKCMMEINSIKNSRIENMILQDDMWNDQYAKESEMGNPTDSEHKNIENTWGSEDTPPYTRWSDEYTVEEEGVD